MKLRLWIFFAWACIVLGCEVERIDCLKHYKFAVGIEYDTGGIIKIGDTILVQIKYSQSMKNLVNGQLTDLNRYKIRPAIFIKGYEGGDFTGWKNSKNATSLFNIEAGNSEVIDGAVNNGLRLDLGDGPTFAATLLIVPKYSGRYYFMWRQQRSISDLFI